MHIDWTQTLVGSDGTAGRPLNAAGIAGPQLAPLVQAGKVVGILFAATLFGLAVALSPLRGKERSLLDAISLSGLLVAHVIGFGLVLRHGAAGLLGSALAGILIPLFALALGAAPAANATLVLIVAADIGLALLSHSAIRRLVPLRIVSGVLAFGILGIAFSYPDAGSSALILGALAPFGTILALLWRTEHSMSSSQPAAVDVNAALLVAAMHRLSGIQVVSDTVGNIERPAKGAPFALHMQADNGLGSSLIDRVMISDRPQLLQALSNAAHSGITTSTFTIRMDIRSTEQTGPQPPRFAPYECSVSPAAGLKGRAVVSLIPAADATSAEITLSAQATEITALCELPSETPALREAMLARAFHDAVSPFNASLGYLEIISDPDLSPDDIVTFRSYAIDARKAVSEAHRNTVLMGRWLRLAHQESRARQAITPAALIEDAIRGFNLAERDDIPAISIKSPKHESEVEVVADACRFAIQILLRSALALEEIPDRIEIEATRVDADLAISIRISGRTEFPKSADAFQVLIENIASTFTELSFHADSPTKRSLMIRNAALADGVKQDATANRVHTIAPRLAS